MTPLSVPFFVSAINLEIDVSVFYDNLYIMLALTWRK